MWIDFGIAHVAQDLNTIHEWIPSIGDKIKHLSINPYVEKTAPIEYFRYIRHNIGMGLFSGSIHYLLTYISLYKLTYDRILSEGWYQLDEGVATLIAKQYPELFTFYYGDYIDIIRNYNRPYNFNNLILNSIRKHLKEYDYKSANDIIEYLLVYYEHSDNYHSELISTILLVDYYINNKCLRPVCIDMINKMFLKLDDNKIEFLKHNLNNINFYDNVKDIIKRIESL
jgi:hypothetical protein